MSKRKLKDLDSWDIPYIEIDECPHNNYQIITFGPILICECGLELENVKAHLAWLEEEARYAL